MITVILNWNVQMYVCVGETCVDDVRICLTLYTLNANK